MHANLNPHCGHKPITLQVAFEQMKLQVLLSTDPQQLIYSLPFIVV